jgi:hypothetical protein
MLCEMGLRGLEWGRMQRTILSSGVEAWKLEERREAGAALVDIAIGVWLCDGLRRRLEKTAEGAIGTTLAVGEENGGRGREQEEDQKSGKI